MKGKQIIILVLVGLVIVLMIQNSVLVKFHLLFWPVYAPLFFLVLGILAVGLIVGFLAAKAERKTPPKPASGREEKPSAATKAGPSTGPEK
ncbi:MAG TPA: LapA family protein [Candidatus Aminicenantes bacterium]|jgi:uncharacterized integral membrane protein|nr:LapA family protein [Candidatus Aminicenantes bacterium]